MSRCSRVAEEAPSCVIKLSVMSLIWNQEKRKQVSRLVCVVPLSSMHIMAGCVHASLVDCFRLRSGSASVQILKALRAYVRLDIVELCHASCLI